MVSFLLFLVGPTLLLAAIAATIVLQGGWEAGAAAVAIVAGAVCLMGFVALLARHDFPTRS
jgi:hypothetical protein